jgi:DNA-3-methyladenine glycosylase II
MNVHDEAELAVAIKALAKACPAMKRAHRAIGVPVWRTREPNYAGLAGIIAYQQVSTRAAATIWGRVVKRLGRVTPKAVLAADIDDLRADGLSRPKISHIRSIAMAVEDGSLSFRRLARASDDAARAELVAVKGVGPWTADVFLMFALGRHDVFPHADIGLSEAYRMLAEEKRRRPPNDFLQVGERWRPYRGVAAVVLWAYIGHVRQQQAGGA